jgi:hypothetical protein
LYLTKLPSFTNTGPPPLLRRFSRVRGDIPQYSAACSVESISHMDLISLPDTGIKSYAIPSIVYDFAPQITFYRAISLVVQIV